MQTTWRGTSRPEDWGPDENSARFRPTQPPAFASQAELDRKAASLKASKAMPAAYAKRSNGAKRVKLEYQPAVRGYEVESSRSIQGREQLKDVPRTTTGRSREREAPRERDNSSHRGSEVPRPTMGMSKGSSGEQPLSYGPSSASGSYERRGEPIASGSRLQDTPTGPRRMREGAAGLAWPSDKPSSTEATYTRPLVEHSTANRKGKARAVAPLPPRPAPPLAPNARTPRPAPPSNSDHPLSNGTKGHRARSPVRHDARLEKRNGQHIRLPTPEPMQSGRAIAAIPSFTSSRSKAKPSTSTAIPRVEPSNRTPAAPSASSRLPSRPIPSAFAPIASISSARPPSAPASQSKPLSKAAKAKGKAKKGPSVQERVPSGRIKLSGLPVRDQRGYAKRLLAPLGLSFEIEAVHKQDIDRCVVVNLGNADVALRAVEVLHGHPFEGHQPVVEQLFVKQKTLRKEERRREEEAKKASIAAPCHTHDSEPHRNASTSSHSPTTNRSMTKRRRSSTTRPPSPERKIVSLSFACDEGMPWYQQSSERETRTALAEATRSGFQVSRHYREGLTLVMEGHQTKIKSEPEAIGVDELIEEVPAAAAPRQQEVTPEPAFIDPFVPSKREAVPISIFPPALPPAPPRYADVTFPMGIYETVSPSLELLDDVLAFLKNFLQLFDESRGSLIDYYKPRASFSYSICGSLPQVSTLMVRRSRNLQASSNVITVTATPDSIINAMRALPAVQHDFSAGFTYDHWPLDGTLDSPLQCIVNGEWEEFATSEIRSFSRSLILVPILGDEIRLPGLRYQVQSDILTIRPHGKLMLELPLRGPTPPPSPVLEPEQILDDLDGYSPPPAAMPDEEVYSPSVPFIEDSDDDLILLDGPPSITALGKRRAPSVFSLSSSGDEIVSPSQHIEAIAISDDDVDSEYYEPPPAEIEEDLQPAIEEHHDDPTSSSGSEESDEDIEPMMDDVREEQETTPEPEALHFEDSRVAFFTPPATSTTGPQRKTKMRALFDCGTKYLAVAKTADVLEWSKCGNRSAVETFHQSSVPQDVHCAAYAPDAAAILLGHQTAKGSEAPQLSLVRHKAARPARYRMLADRPHANGVSALCSVPLPSGDTVPIVSGGWDHAVKLWQLPVEDGGAAAPRIESLPKLHKSVVQALAWSGGEDALLSGGADGRIFGWDINTMKVKTSIKWKEQSRVSQLQACPGQEHVALVTLSSHDDQLRLYDLRDLQPVGRFGFRSENLLNLTSFARGAFSPSGHLFALPAEDKLRLWDTRNLAQPIHLLDSPSPGGVHVAFESDDEIAVLESSSFAYHRIVL